MPVMSHRPGSTIPATMEQCYGIFDSTRSCSLVIPSSPCSFLQCVRQAVKKGCLGCFQFAPGQFKRKKTGLVDFWKTLHLSRARGPHHFESVRANLEIVRQISLEGPGMNSFAAFLLDRSQIDPIAGRGNSHFFFELGSCPL